MLSDDVVEDGDHGTSRDPHKNRINRIGFKAFQSLVDLLYIFISVTYLAIQTPTILRSDPSQIYSSKLNITHGASFKLNNTTDARVNGALGRVT